MSTIDLGLEYVVLNRRPGDLFRAWLGDDPTHEGLRRLVCGIVTSAAAEVVRVEPGRADGESIVTIRAPIDGRGPACFDFARTALPAPDGRKRVTFLIRFRPVDEPARESVA